MFLSDVDLYYLKNEEGVDVSDTATIELCTSFTDLTLMPENEKEQHIDFRSYDRTSFYPARISKKCL